MECRFTDKAQLCFNDYNINIFVFLKKKTTTKKTLHVFPDLMILKRSQGRKQSIGGGQSKTENVLLPQTTVLCIDFHPDVSWLRKMSKNHIFYIKREGLLYCRSIIEGPKWYNLMNKQEKFYLIHKIN